MSIFDSLVWSFECEISNVRQQTLNCALSVDFLWKQRLKIGRTCFRLRAEADYEWSDFVGAVAAADANFDPATAGSPFLTESLILAQNERWRRG